MPNKELLEYISSLKSKGVSDETIKAELLKHGWPESEISPAFSVENNDQITLPPPPVPHFGMWVTFKYVLLFVCLYVSATSFGGILHDAVNKLLPDNLDNIRYSSYSSGDDYLLKAYFAGIIVTFPIFAALFFSLKRETLNHPAVKNIKARKNLFYITLVVTFIIMVGHLISTVYGFLDGSTTARSLAHLFVTFLVAGSIFSYLLLQVKEDRKTF
jgi:hypothetical protein